MAWRREYFWPVVLVVVGVFFLLNNIGALWWLRFDVVWPVLLILLGVWLMVRPRRR
jgi:phage shock protein C